MKYRIMLHDSAAVAMLITNDLLGNVDAHGFIDVNAWLDLVQPFLTARTRCGNLRTYGVAPLLQTPPLALPFGLKLSLEISHLLIARAVRRRVIRPTLLLLGACGRHWV